MTIAGEVTLAKDAGQTMKKWREIFSISQTELAEYLKVSSSTISDYEGGRRKSPGIGIIRRFVEALLSMDEIKGGKMRKQLEKDFEPKEDIFDIHEFASAVDGKNFTDAIGAKVVANPGKLKIAKIYGFTVVDSLKVILDVPVHEYMKMYGKTPERALIFLKVETGRSPMIAVKVGRFSTEMRPSIVVLHGLDKIDPIAVKIAESEKIPLLVTNKPIDEIITALKKFED